MQQKQLNTPDDSVEQVTFWQAFLFWLKLGFISFGGPAGQIAVYAYAKHSFTTIQQLDQWGIKFEKDETGEFAVKKVHHMGAYVLPMPEGHDVKKVLYRQLKRAQVKINNRIVTTKLLKNEQGAI
ncbi:hypothetical protein ACFMJX_17420, partial [Acinetobacter baumannii]